MSICHENHEMPYCPKFCQLIRKIIRIVATRCQISGGKNVQNLILAGAPTQTPFGELTALLRWWSLQRSLTPCLHLRGPTFKVRGRGRKVNEGEKEGRKRSLPPPIFTTDRRHRLWRLDMRYSGGRLGQAGWGLARGVWSCILKTV